MLLHSLFLGAHVPPYSKDKTMDEYPGVMERGRYILQLKCLTKF